ncbi:MAG: sigma-70 family RNA polymerase sigma factor [Verrucomicrobia bacterium]|nr:sigma-70 family RNA polymerase sigma factor [Verrucomicrobiota bacterium]
MQATRQSLLERLRDPSDQGAWKEFYEMYWAVIVRYAQKQGLDETSAYDVLQETMVALVCRLPTFRYNPKIGLFRNYLLTIVTRLCRKARRRAARRSEVPIDDDSRDALPLLGSFSDETIPGPDEAAETQWRESLWEEALRRVCADPSLQGRTFAVFRAYLLDNLPADEVARKFGIEKNAVYQIKNRIMRRLKLEIERMTKDMEGDPDA